MNGLAPELEDLAAIAQAAIADACAAGEPHPWAGGVLLVERTAFGRVEAPVPYAFEAWASAARAAGLVEGVASFDAVVRSRRTGVAVVLQCNRSGKIAVLGMPAAGRLARVDMQAEG